MEQSISSLAFRGSIPEAITEAKRQKKLFVVYISGDNTESVLLDESTWTDPSVAESLSKYCILLHLPEGTTDTAQFSALYPQRSAPCLTAIGYNGVQLWQNEGFVSAEELASSLEKMWLSLHIQETTATFLTAALSSGKSGQIASGDSHTASFEVGSSSASDAPVSSTDKYVSNAEAISAERDSEESKLSEVPVEEIKPKVVDEVTTASAFDDKLENGNIEQPAPSIDSTGESVSSFEEGCSNSANLAVADQDFGVSLEAPREIGDEASEILGPKRPESLQVEKADILDASENKSNDVHLSIRLPNCVSLQEKFSATSTLRIVKGCVDGKLESSIGSYDLAIPYPRKVFTDQELGKTLSELGLLNRQALIVVPHLRAGGHNRGGSNLSHQTTSSSAGGSSNESREGYVSFVTRILSYMNPFSYLGGAASSSNSVQDLQSPAWQYGPPQSNPTGSRRSYQVSPNQSTPANERNNKTSKEQTSSRFGSNIHTLKHDEDDSNFTDRNAFWNGNSTQYGGDGDNK